MTSGLWFVLAEWVVGSGIGVALLTVLYLGAEELVYRLRGKERAR